MPPTPRVSVILPTHARPHLVCRALESALAQSLAEIEVIVVVDGRDPRTLAVLREVGDRRVRVHVEETAGGQPAAINHGIRLARAPWCALLDDDDEWLPGKLAAQLAAAEASPHASPVVVCRFLARSASGDRLWPGRAPRAGERTGDYLFCRTRASFGEGVLPTSLFFAPTALFRRVPLDATLPKHCDLDWLVRVDAEPDTGLELPASPEPLAVWHQEGADRISHHHDWRFSTRWIGSMRPFVTPRAYAGFLLTWASYSARAQREPGAFVALLRDAFRHGRPSALEVAVHAAVWCLPGGLRERWSAALDRSPEAHPAGGPR
jgi:glycosyltransferase involved in cell wall biosynthesis